ncbi:MAG TPA: AsnC family transcriptional regulator [Candidatus Nitrosocosmicus sp.]|nr:AsnC family transcriptional regulator [Candidatus Nitrosocosmicus sp.]
MDNNYMPVSLDEIDVSIIKSILEDGRKPFRQISRETGITTPTVIARYERLVNIGFIKGVLPVFDFEKLGSEDNDTDTHIQLEEQLAKNIQNRSAITTRNPKSNLKEEISEVQKKITTGVAIKVVCDFCDGLIFGKPKILKFANIERFFCCVSCKSGYSQKYHGRIESIKRKYEGKSEIDE